MEEQERIRKGGRAEEPEDDEVDGWRLTFFDRWLFREYSFLFLFFYKFILTIITILNDEIKPKFIARNRHST